jgi:hypothetical protein
MLESEVVLSSAFIQCVEDTFVTYKHYARTLIYIHNQERLIPFIEEYYSLESEYEEAYDSFMESPSVAAYEILGKADDALWDYLDNVLQPKIDEPHPKG